MDIYLTNLETQDRLRFPMLPTEVSVKRANQFANYTILKIGEVRIPSGTSLDGFSWNGIFPGEKRKKDPYIRQWASPKQCYKFIEQLKTQSGKPVKARLLITETAINCDVYLNSFTGQHTGGYGDINYSISLIQAKVIKVTTTPAPEAAEEAEPLQNTPAETQPERPEPPAEQTVTVKSGDSLWAIAQRAYRNGAEYSRIYEANKGTIGSNQNLIYPGQVLVIPQ